MRLETYAIRINDLRVDYELDSTFSKVTGKISVDLERASASATSELQIIYSVTHSGDTVFEASADTISADFAFSKPNLWYPHGYGAQPLYEFKVKVLGADGSEVASASKKIGFRQALLIQEPDEIGKSFYFRINGVDVFCGGSDWIPADNFTPRVTEEKYRKWLELMVDGYQVMIRQVC